MPFPRSEIALATQSFGQGMTATTLQVAAAYGALANDGVLMKPYLVSKVVDSDGVVLLENKPTVVRRVVSQGDRAAGGLACSRRWWSRAAPPPKARMDEYRVAGKTGTAQKADPIARGYSDKCIASFVGMVPAEAPRAVILVVIDEPKTDVYGGLVAAPAFKEIATAGDAAPGRASVASGDGDREKVQVVAKPGRSARASQSLILAIESTRDRSTRSPKRWSPTEPFGSPT